MAQNIIIRLPDGDNLEFPSGTCVSELATSLGSSFSGAAIAGLVDGKLVDLNTALIDGSTVAIVQANSPAGREIIRHSTAHVLAQAVLNLWPGSHFAIGPSIENGFYYDFQLPNEAHFNDEDMERIEDEMRRIISQDQPFVRQELSISQGLDLFADQPFKKEIIQAISQTDLEELDAEVASEQTTTKTGKSIVSIYRNTDTFADLCRGPHVSATSRLGAFKLTRVAGAYWRGQESNPQLQRIYGTAWESDEALEKHLTQLKEAEKRDHRKLGIEMDLFHFPNEIGGGLPVFHPKGGLIRMLMEDFSRQQHQKANYEFVWTPHIAKEELFKTSGHLQWYSEGMYPPMKLEGSTYYPKPMNCPMHILIYSSNMRSYKELPLRLFEFGTVYRFERSGVLHGLTRVRGFTQDDAHIFCTPDQLGDELHSLLKFVLEMLKAFGLTDFEAELATRPKKYVGDLQDWEVATSALQSALDSVNIPYVVAEGEGAFYAPKIDVHVRDAIGRRWQISTLQVDFQLPQRFDIEYVGPDNQRHRPYMIHRALFGSLERFFAILLEHYAGAFPTWLSPVQVEVLPVRDTHQDYAMSVADQLKAEGIRAQISYADQPLGARIRKAKIEKIPYVLVVGDEDITNGTVGVNVRDTSKPTRGVDLGSFISHIKKENSEHQTSPSTLGDV